MLAQFALFRVPVVCEYVANLVVEGAHFLENVRVVEVAFGVQLMQVFV